MSILHVAFYPSDWLAGTRGLSDAETGVYITLIARMYEMAGPIELDEKRLSRLCGCDTTKSFRESLDYLIDEGKIQKNGSEIYNNRVQKEVDKVVGKSERAAAAAAARWDAKNKSNAGGEKQAPKNGKSNKNNDRSDANAFAKHPDRMQKGMQQPMQDGMQQPMPEGMPNACESDAADHATPHATADASQNQSQRREGSDTNVSAKNTRFDTIKDKVWGEGVPYLTSQSVPDKKARQMIGKWLKTFTPEQVDHALREAGNANTGDPVPYIIRVLTSSDAEHSPDFIKFWAKYPESPNKTDREQTARAFAAVLAGDDPPTVDQLCAAARAVTADDPKFIPSPRRWLEGRRWEAAAQSEVHPFPGHPVLGQLKATKTAYAAARTYFDNHPDEEADHQAGLATLRKIYGGVV